MIGCDVRLVRCDPDGRPVEPLGPMTGMVEESCRGCAELYARIGYLPPWVGYISVAGALPVGGGAFVGAPREGRAEIAYFTAPEFEARGYASATARALVALAQSFDPTITLIAKTLPQKNPSTRILEKLGFHFVGETTDEDVGLAWLWELPSDARP